MSDKPEADDFELRMEQTRQLRQEFVSALMRDGVPTDKDGGRMFLAALKDMDSAEIGKARIKVDDKVANSNANVAEFCGKLVEQLGDRNPFMREIPEDMPPPPPPVADESQLGHYDFEPGEKEQGMILESLPDLEKKLRAEGKID